MSVYVLKSRDLYKIGFSSNLPDRVSKIMETVPGAVEFVGHMPGGMDVEAHLHERFADARFSGEWFTECPRILAFIEACLDPEMPQPASPRVPGYWRGDKERSELSRLVRTACARAWPEANHAVRIHNLAGEIGWGERRVKSVYHCERYVLLATEAPALDRWLADWITPEMTVDPVLAADARQIKPMED